MKKLPVSKNSKICIIGRASDLAKRFIVFHDRVLGVKVLKLKTYLKRECNMKKSKVMSLVVLLFLVLALTLIPSGNVSALGTGDFFLTDEELPSSCRINTSFFKTWPGPSMSVRMRLMGGNWTGKVYTCGRMVTVCVGYYPTEEEAKKWMNPDVYIYEMDVYGGIGYQGTTLSEWALQSNEYEVHSFSSGTAYGDEGFTTHDITHKSYGDDKGAVIQVKTDNIFRIRNIIFHIVGTEGLLDPLVAEKARRLLGKPVNDEDGDGVPDDVDKCCKTPKGHKVDKSGCPECPSGTIYDPSSEEADKKTGCSPKVAVVFTTYADPSHRKSERKAMLYGIAALKVRYRKEGYKIIDVPLPGKKDGVEWHSDQEIMIKYLTRPSTKAMAFFGHGGTKIVKGLVFNTYTPTLGGYQASEFYIEIYKKLKPHYMQFDFYQRERLIIKLMRKRAISVLKMPICSPAIHWMIIVCAISLYHRKREYIGVIQVYIMAY